MEAKFSTALSFVTYWEELRKAITEKSPFLAPKSKCNLFRLVLIFVRLGILVCISLNPTSKNLLAFPPVFESILKIIAIKSQ